MEEINGNAEFAEMQALGMPQQVAAFAGFAFNIGAGNLQISAPLHRVNDGDYQNETAADQFGH